MEKVNEDAWDVKEFEDFLMATHREYFKSEVCGFSQWMDNHMGYDAMGVSLDTYATHWRAKDLPFHWWTMSMEDTKTKHGHRVEGPPSGNMYQIYGVDPTGFAVQFDG